MFNLQESIRTQVQLLVVNVAIEAGIIQTKLVKYFM